MKSVDLLPKIDAKNDIEPSKKLDTSADADDLRSQVTRKS